LTKAEGGRKRTASGRDKRSTTDELIRKSGEAVAVVAETFAELAKRYQLEILRHLLGMAQFEAEEHLRLRTKRRSS
jgi:hypothetical protein